MLVLDACPDARARARCELVPCRTSSSSLACSCSSSCRAHPVVLDPRAVRVAQSHRASTAPRSVNRISCVLRPAVLRSSPPACFIPSMWDVLMFRCSTFSRTPRTGPPLHRGLTIPPLPPATSSLQPPEHGLHFMGTRTAHTVPPDVFALTLLLRASTHVVRGRQDLDCRSRQVVHGACGRGVLDRTGECAGRAVSGSDPEGRHAGGLRRGGHLGRSSADPQRRLSTRTFPGVGCTACERCRA